MANLNLEPGQSAFSSMVGAIERGVYMKTNCSWSIDDSRNKFQFGCEWGQLIEDGKLTTVVKKPNYRGVSATFWRNLARVGNLDSYEVLGTPFCGQGRTQSGHPGWACRSGLRVLGRRGLRWRARVNVSSIYMVSGGYVYSL